MHAGLRIPPGTLDQTGISVWEEDWSEVGVALTSLRYAGHDPMDFLAGQPELMEALHGTVHITNVNQATLHLTGLSDTSLLIGRLADIVPDSIRTFRTWVTAMARGDRFLRVESHIRHADGSQRDCLVMVRLPTMLAEYSRILVCVADITDYKADQARLAEAERESHRAFRASAVGMLTAAIAHEVNNPLAAVVTNAEAALRWLRRASPDAAEAEGAILALIQDALRARDVVDRTRLLLARNVTRAVALDARQAAEDSLRLVEHDLRVADAEASLHAMPGLPAVMADPVQLQQILTNLLRNAAQALETTPAPREVALRMQAHRDGVLMTVTDNGPGIAADRLLRVFEPFFSTKAGGLGVGLAICRACAEANGGRLWVTSVEGVGSSFHLLLPSAR